MRNHSLTKILLSIFFISIVCSQGTWQWTGRVHTELEWRTLKTEHFNIHYHNGIEEIAVRGASLAEQAHRRYNAERFRVIPRGKHA